MLTFLQSSVLRSDQRVTGPKLKDCLRNERLAENIKYIYYIKFSGILSGSKSIKTLSRQWRYHFYPHMCDIIFDQSARSIFARCQALVVFRRVSAV